MRAALRLVWALDVRHLVAHRTRLALSALGIAVGVALAVAVGSLSTSITGSLKSAAQAAAAEANIEVRPNGNVGLPPHLLGEVRRARGVEEAGATIESYVRTRRSDSGDGRELRVLALGVDSGIIEMSPQAIAPDQLVGVDPNGVFVPNDVADELDISKGQRIEITTPQGWKQVVVGAVLPPEASQHTRVVIGTVGLLQELLDKGDRFDAIYVKATDADAGLKDVQDAVGPAARVGPVAFRGEQLEQLLAGANASFSVGTLVALFVGAFLVYNTMAMAAVERLQEAALLRAIGAKRRQVFALFLTEGALLGIVGSALGVGLGLLLASRLLTQQGGALEEIYPIQVTALTISPAILAGAGIAGVFSAIVAALLPARRIARADPAPTLGPTAALEDTTRRPRRMTTIGGILLAVAGAVVSTLSVLSGSGTSSSLVIVGLAMTLAGIALLIPVAVPAIAGLVLRRLASMRRAPAVVRLAAGEVLRSPGRTAFTVGAVLLSLSLVVGFSIAQSSFSRAFDAAFEDIISGDYYLRSATWRPFGSDVPMDDELVSKIEAIDGVQAAWPFRLMPATYEDRAIVVLAYDLDKYGRYGRADGQARREFQAQARAVGDKDAVLASSSLLAQFGHRVGDEITLPTPEGLAKLEIAGAFDDPSAVTPEFVFDHETFKRIWGAGGADTFALTTERGRSPEVSAALQRTFAPLGIEVETGDEYFARLAEAVNSVLQLVTSVQLVAVIVAGLGLANTLLISTLERRRDLGVLRAVGMLRKQLRRMVAAEAVVIGGLGVLMAWGLGTLVGIGMATVIEAQLGVAIHTVFPPLGYAWAAILGLLAAFVASIYPAQRAARLDVVAALAYE